MKKRPVVLIILDGFGLCDHEHGNAVKQARMPFFDYLYQSYPHNTIDPAQEAAGLVPGQIGSSEVGHLNMGAGRIVLQDLPRINRAIEKGTFFTNKVLMDTIKYVKASGKSLHLMGLLSDGGVHSHIDHLFALVQLAHHHALDKVYIHCFLDGRDVEPQSAKKYLRQLEKFLERIGTGTIATIVGRYYAMDRDSRWKREKKAYDLLVHGKGILIRDPMEAVNSAYRNNLSDEFVKPTLINQGGLLKPGDAVVLFNFRPDRARELVRSLTNPQFKKFRTKELDLHFVCMTSYDQSFNLPVAFPPPAIKNSLAEFLAAKKKKQLHIAETEKYAHVTFFFNGGIEKPYPGEDRILVPSPQVPTYDRQPEMSAPAITRNLVRNMKKDKYDFMVVNFANPDMVGHTGKFKATVKALECTDACVAKIVKQVEQQKGVAIITADHGNAECMLDKYGRPLTAHTTNLVPVIVTKQGLKVRKGKLADIAPTVLKLMRLKPPKEMTGKCLVRS